MVQISQLNFYLIELCIENMLLIPGHPKKNVTQI